MTEQYVLACFCAAQQALLKEREEVAGGCE